MIFSGKQVAKAGDTLRNTEIYDNDEAINKAFEILNYWRLLHEDALKKAFDLVNQESKKIDSKAIVAKRLKRHISIVAKLRRFEEKNMKLNRMQDVAGCRAVVSSKKKVFQLVRMLKKSHDFKNENGIFKHNDYINNPKPDGYRSYHLMGRFGSPSRLVEIQVRTRLQHCWATALEIIDLFTDQALKSNAGKQHWSDFFKYTSYQFSVMEGIHFFEKMNGEDRLVSYLNHYKNKKMKYFEEENHIKCCKLIKDLDVFDTLKSYSQSLIFVSNTLNETPMDGYILLKIDMEQKKLESKYFKKNQGGIASKEYTDAEQKYANKSKNIVALVSTNAVGGIKEAYPNFFADSTIFLEYLEYIRFFGEIKYPRGLLSKLFWPRDVRL